MKRVAIAADHAGFPLKQDIINVVIAEEFEPLDLGTFNEEPVDYPDYAAAVAETIRKGDAAEGILICGSGVGASVAANKFPGIRAGLCHDTYSAHQSREHDDCNVLCLGPRVLGKSLALDIVRVWLHASFTNEERHRRRLQKLAAYEKQYLRF